MSEENDSATHSESESTIEELEVDGVIGILEQAAEDAVELKDWLLYSTVLDYYLSDREKYTTNEQEQLLSSLAQTLSTHKELVYHAGWDIPGLLIAYIDQDRVTTPLRTLPCLLQVMKCFEVLALEGNHKELLLKGCELLTSIKLEDHTYIDDDLEKQSYYQIKVHCLIELIVTSLRNIHTLYPSRFLAMAVTALFNVIEYCKDEAGLRIFVVKRAYSFARDYSAPTVVDVPDLTEKELKKIIDDEAYLQRKLLRGFLTQFICILSTNYPFGMSGDYASYLAAGDKLNNDWFNAHQTYPAYSRVSELVLAFDIDLHQKLRDYVSSSHELFKDFDYKEDQDELTAKIFLAILKDHEANASNSMLDGSGEKLTDSLDGCLLLYSYLQCARNACDEIALTFNDVLVCTLRLVVPAMLNPVYLNSGVQDMVVFWAWVALNKLQVGVKLLKLEISTISSTLLKIYYQCLLFITLSQWQISGVRSATLTLFTKLLTHTHEKIAYEFIHDTLENFPHEAIKGAVIGVLKELMTKERSSSMNEELDLSKLDVKDKKGPELPPREVKVTNKYIALTDERVSDLLKLVDTAVDNTIVNNRLNQETFGTLVAYLNLLVALKQGLKQNPEFEKLVKKTTRLVDSAEKEIKGEQQSRGLTEKNAVGILRVSLDRLDV